MVEAQSNFDIAQRFMANKGITLVNDGKSATRSDGEPYSIFKGEDNKGFVIVVNGSVVGYSTENGVNDNDVPEALRDMLRVYSKASTRFGTEPSEYPSYFKERDMTPIEPLIKTHWYQLSPYNDLTKIKEGICAIVAWAQLVHYFGISQNYSEIVLSKWDGIGYVASGEVIPMTTFDNSKILDEYVDGNYSEEEAYEIARFFQYIEYSIEWGIYEEALFEMTWNVEKTEIQRWQVESNYEKYDELLELGIPLFQMGFNHNYNIDGRDSKGLYHVNFGWGGFYDGYYVFPDKCTQETNALIDVDFTLGSGGIFYIVPKGWTSSIKDTKTNKRITTSVYNLQGQKVGESIEKLPKGIYIKDGKKQLVR